MDKKQELLNRIEILEQQLYVIINYPKSFEEKLGKRGIKDKIDEILDEIITHRKIIKIIKNKENE